MTDAVTVILQPEPAVTVAAQMVRVAVGIPGLQGPPGPKGDPGDGSALVLSVNGQIGDVVLDAEDVQADPAGAAIAAASAAVALHIADPNPHPQYIATNGIIDGGNF